MKRRISLSLLLTAIAGTALVSTVQANTEKKGTSAISGVVLGPNDKPVARATITYQSSAGNAAHVVHTDSRGYFTVCKLPADNYDLRASANGIFSEWEKNFTVHTGETRSITLRLIYAKQMPKPGTLAGSKPH
jgi:hypothetical protein